MRTVKFLCVCLMALTVSSGYAGLRYGSMPAQEVADLPTRPVLIKTQNEALQKAMKAHNLLAEIPILEDLNRSLDMIERNLGLLNKTMKNLRKCGRLAFGGKYKNSDEILEQAVTEYKDEAKKVENEYKAQEGKDAFIPLMLTDQAQFRATKQKAGRNVFRNIANNPAKYGAQFVNEDAKKSGSFVNEEEEPTLNVLEAISESNTALHNTELSKKELEKTRQDVAKHFEAGLKSVGLEYKDIDILQPAGLAQVRADLMRVKRVAIEEAEKHIAALDAQDRQHPELVTKRTYRSPSTQRVANQVQKKFPEAAQGITLIRQLAPQRQQEVIVAALKKDVNGTVYLTETNVVEIDRKMKEREAHTDLMNYFKTIADDSIPADIPEFDFSLCRA